MEQTTILLEHLIRDTKLYLITSGYSKSTIDRYNSCWKKLLKCYRIKGFEQFSLEICLSIIKDEYHIPSNEKLQHHHVFYIRTIKILDEFLQYGKILRCHQNSGMKVATEFKGILKHFIDVFYDSGLSERTIKSKEIQITRFLNYIRENFIEKIDQLSADVVLSYTKSLTEMGYARSTRSGILFTLRSFLSFLSKENYISIPLHELFPVIFSNKMERIPSYYYEEELKSILSNVDRDNIIGKRDYLILILAIQLGIRAGDIRLMKLEYIHWEKNTIEFVQQKTGNPIQLPLPENVKYALVDYLRFENRKVEQSFLFLRQRAPFEPYEKTNVFHYVITKYMKKAGISFCNRKHGLHSMRHSLASNLLKNNTPYPVITGILGHENSNTTRLYLSIDIDQLRSLALEVPYEE